MLQPYLAHAPVMAVKLLEMVFIKFGLFEIWGFYSGESKIQVIWDLTLREWVSDVRRFEVTRRLHFQGVSIYL
jgi:hypothetical protein